MTTKNLKIELTEYQELPPIPIKSIL